MVEVQICAYCTYKVHITCKCKLCISCT